MGTFTFWPARRSRARRLGLRWLVASASVFVLVAVGTSRELQPIPSADEQAEAMQAVRERYADRYASAATAAEKAAMAEEMLDEAAGSDEPARQFALWKAAGNMGVSSGDPVLAIRAVDAMAAVFEFDVLQTRVAMLERVAATVQPGLSKGNLVKLAVGFLDFALNADRPELAEKLEHIALAAVDANDAEALGHVLRNDNRGFYGDVHYVLGKYFELHGKPELAVEYWKKSMAHFDIDGLSRTLAGAELVKRGIEPEVYKDWALNGLPPGQLVVPEARPAFEIVLDDTEPVPEIEPRPLGPESAVVVVPPPSLTGRARTTTRAAAELACDLLAEQLDATGTSRVVTREQLAQLVKERELSADVAGPMLSYDALARLEIDVEGNPPQAHLRLVDLSTGNLLARESFDWPVGRAGVARMVLACRAGLDEAPKALENKLKVRLLGIEAPRLHARMRPLGRRAHEVFTAAMLESDRLLLVQNLEVASSREEALLLAMGLSRSPGSRQFSPQSDATIEFRLVEIDAVGKTFEETQIELGVRLRRGEAYQGDWVDVGGQVKDFDRMIAEAWAKVAASLSEAAPGAARNALDARALRRKQAEAEYQAAMAVDSKLPLVKRAKAKLVHLDAALKLDPDHEPAAYEAFYERFQIAQHVNRTSPDLESVVDMLSAAVDYLRRFDGNWEHRLRAAHYSNSIMFQTPVQPWRSGQEYVEPSPEVWRIVDAAKEIVEHSVSGDVRAFVWQGGTAAMLGVACRGMKASGLPLEHRTGWLESILRLADDQATQIEKITGRDADQQARNRRRVLAGYQALKAAAAELVHEDGHSDWARRLLAEVCEFLDDPASGASWGEKGGPARSQVRRLLAAIDPGAVVKFDEWAGKAARAERPASRSMTWPRIGFYDPDPEASIHPRYVVAQRVGDADYPAVRPLGEIDGRFYVHLGHRAPVVACLPLDAQGNPIGGEQYHGRNADRTWDNIRPLAMPDDLLPWARCAVVRNDRLYLGTSNRGLVVFHPETEQWTAYGTEEGLPAMSVESIVPLDGTTLYCTTAGAHYTFNTGDGTVTLVRRSNPDNRNEAVPKHMLYAWRHEGRWMGLSDVSVWEDLLNGASEPASLRSQYGPDMRQRSYWSLGDAVGAERINSRQFFTCYNGLCEFDAEGAIVRCWPSRLDARLLEAARAAGFEVPGYAPVFEGARVVQVGGLLVFLANESSSFDVSAYDPASDTWYGPIHGVGAGWAERGDPMRYGAVASEHGAWVGGMRGAGFVRLDDILETARRAGRAMTTVELQEQLQRRLDAAPPLERAKMHVRMRQYDRAERLLDELLAMDPEHDEALALKREMEKNR